MSERMTKQAAEAALAGHDWAAAELYWADLQESDPAAAEAWLSTIEAEATPPAAANERDALHARGFVSLMRYKGRPVEDIEHLRDALRWFMAAARRDEGGHMIEQVVVWYGYANRPGSHFQDESVRQFLSEPPIRERYLGFRGPDNWLERHLAGQWG